MNLRKLAKGQECQVRIPGICNRDPETTVLAHLNGGGIGRKQPDLLGAWCCSACHDYVDARTQVNKSSTEQRGIYLLSGIIRTQQKLLDMGLQGAIDAWKE